MDPTWALALDLAGVFFFAISGSLLAVERGYDLVGSLLLGALTGLGGGLMRDLILDTPPTAFASPIHQLAPLAAALVVLFFYDLVKQFPRALLVFDAGGLALFCVTGTVKALESGMVPTSAVVLGVITASGGGLLRDVVANRDPQLFNRRDLYAVPALVGATVAALLWEADLMSVGTGFLTSLLVFVFRGLSLKFRWRIPRANDPGRLRRR